MSGFAFTPENTRMLLNLMIYTADEKAKGFILQIMLHKNVLIIRKQKSW